MQVVRMIIAFAKVLTVRYMRDKTALFFTFAFPLIFLVIFGGVFGGNNGISFDVAIVNNSSEQFAGDFVNSLSEGEILKPTTSESVDAAREPLGRGEIDAIIELPKGFGQLNQAGQPSGNLVFYYKEADAQLKQSLEALLESILDDINQQFVAVTPPLTLTSDPIDVSNLTQFDYTFSGLLGFAILSLGIFSMTEGFAADKKNGALRRLRVAPLRTWQMITATALSRVFVGLLSIGLMFAVAVVMFSFEMRGDYVSFILFSIISTVCIFGFGIAIAGWAKDGNQAAPLSQAVAMPMMFLSGVFFPRFIMPEWLQSTTQYIPLTPVVDGLRMILTEGKTFIDLGPQLLIIGLWSILIYVIAFRVFRWE